MQKEAKARIKINALLQEAGWRFLMMCTGSKQAEWRSASLYQGDKASV